MIKCQFLWVSPRPSTNTVDLICVLPSFKRSHIWANWKKEIMHSKVCCRKGYAVGRVLKFTLPETSKNGPGLLSTKRNFHLPITTFQGDFAVGFREGKTFRVIQTINYCNGNPSRKTRLHLQKKQVPFKFHDHSCSFFEHNSLPSNDHISKRRWYCWWPPEIRDPLTSLRERWLIPLFARV